MAAFQQMRARMAARRHTVADTPDAGRGARSVGDDRGGQLCLGPSQRGRSLQWRGQGMPGAAGCNGQGEGEETDDYENDSWLVDGELSCQTC